jgi:hypothetical protein
VYHDLKDYFSRIDGKVPVFNFPTLSFEEPESNNLPNLSLQPIKLVSIMPQYPSEDGHFSSKTHSKHSNRRFVSMKF